MAGANFQQLLNSGVGATKRSLGPNNVLGFFLNGVELQFAIGAPIWTIYSAFVARQLAGAEVHWIKRGSPLGSPWLRVSSTTTSRPDDPDPGNVAENLPLFAYFDSPGPNPGNSLYSGATRIQVVQNFTGWVEGKSAATGGFENLCDDVAPWFSVVDIVNVNWDGSSDGGASWQFSGATTSGTGSRDTNSAPAI